VPDIDELYEFLNTDEDEAVDPELLEFEGFTSGFIAPWKASVLYTLGNEQDYEVAELGYEFKRKAGSWGWFYYFGKHEVAIAAKEVMGNEFPPNAEWCFRCVTADVLNFASDETRAKFGDDLFYSGRAIGIGSRKYGPELHQVMLPAAVATIATASGIENPGFDLSLLHDLNGDSSEDECQRLVGGGDVKLDADDPEERPILWQQRVELWAALGEPNPKKSQMIGGGKLATESETLSRCLGIFYHSWKSSPWARVVPVPNPRYDAVSGTGNRLSLPALVDLYPSQDAAQEAAGTAGGTSPTATGEPVIPDMWKELPGEFRAEIRKIKESGKPLPIAFREVGGEKLFGCTLAELTAWLDHV
jgi:hypothetical protein